MVTFDALLGTIARYVERMLGASQNAYKTLNHSIFLESIVYRRLIKTSQIRSLVTVHLTVYRRFPR